MNHQDEQVFSDFSDVAQILENAEKFKRKLGIGNDTLTTLRKSTLVSRPQIITGAAKLGATVATSQPVAGLFGTFWTSIGIGTAVTPIGWVVVATVVSGGVCYAVIRLIESSEDSRSTAPPQFLNTALDVLATSIIHFMGSLIFKVALIGGPLDQVGRNRIKRYFIEEWGYDEAYIDQALMALETSIEMPHVEMITKAFADFAIENPSCDFKKIRKETKAILMEVALADGQLDDREEIIIEWIDQSLAKHDSVSRTVSRTAKSFKRKLSSKAGAIINKVKRKADKTA